MASIPPIQLVVEISSSRRAVEHRLPAGDERQIFIDNWSPQSSLLDRGAVRVRPGDRSVYESRLEQLAEAYTRSIVRSRMTFAEYLAAQLVHDDE